MNEEIALRSWRLVPYAYYIRGQREAVGLRREEFELLSMCDGQHELPDSDLLDRMMRRGMISRCEGGEALTEWQKPRICDNRYFPAMNWMITGRCNYNCLHCFNAADNSRLQTEFTREEAMRLIREAEQCGVNAITITGGEPTMHPFFMDIIREIHKRGMYVMELNTNGAFFTQQLLDSMKEAGCFPRIKISFDGIGHHDWLRNKQGAEEETLRAIRLCVDNGFRVMAQTNVHRLNIHTMLPTMKMLNSIGVEHTRIIRTSEGPRWLQNAGDACLSMREYYDGMLEMASEYIKTDCKMSLDIWQFMCVYPLSRRYIPRPIIYNEGEYKDSRPVCRGNRGLIAVTSSGDVVPCNQMSGFYQKHGYHLGNVKTDGLQPLLQDSTYLCEVCTTVGQLKSENDTCAACPVFSYCAGGCRAIALALTDDRMGVDPAKCLYFREGYLEKTEQAMQGYTSTLEGVHSHVKECRAAFHQS